MQHCTHMNFLSFFCDRDLFWWYLINSGLFFFLKPKTTENLKVFFLSFCYKIL
ncbi:unnamed protein product [Staurois parvus]|uniref:Uncharacterized protein n=1 Tax=Staurois parvus TaxID=386267 RepID=A0ABN9GQ97_9NEOB|nr:unnamed protein product [Staurois parvus]